MTQTEVNKVDITVNPAFFEQYNVFKIKANKKLWEKLDKLDFEAFCGMGSKGDVNLYVLTKESRSVVHKKLEENEVPFDTIASNSDIPLKLLVNAVCRKPGYAVIAGRNFCLLPVSFHSGDKLRKIVDIPEIWASSDNVISIHSVRFIRYNPDRDEDVPAYRYKDGEFVRDFHPNEECFIKHGIRDKKAKALSYLDTSVNGYLKSRVAIVRMVVDKINETFKGLIELSFCSAADIYSFRGESAKKYQNILDENITQHFKDGVLSDITEIYEYYNIPKEGQCRIRLIEKEEDYDEGKDEHIKSLNVQHITRPVYSEAIEKGQLEPIARGCLTELAIKQDILGNIDCFSGYIHSLDDSATFFLKKDSKFCYAKKNGMFMEFGCFTLNDPPSWARDEILDAEENYIIERNSCVLGLKATSMFPITDSDAWQTINREHGKIRGKEHRNNVLGSLIDAHLFEMDGHIYYFSSVIGKGMQSSILKADTLMEIVEYKKDISYEWLMPYVCVTYINAGNRFTKYPYPFKYIKEWANVNGCDWACEI